MVVLRQIDSTLDGGSQVSGLSRPQRAPEAMRNAVGAEKAKWEPKAATNAEFDGAATTACAGRHLLTPQCSHQFTDAIRSKSDLCICYS